MSEHLDIARSRLQEAGTSILMEMGRAKSDEQQESLALMEKGINEIEALISSYPKAANERI